MFVQNRDFDALLWLTLLALMAVATWAAAGLSRVEADYDRPDRASVCAPRGKAGAACLAGASDEPPADARCVSHGRGGRICLDRAE